MPWITLHEEFMAKALLIPSREQPRAGWRAYGVGDVSRREADAIVGELLMLGSAHCRSHKSRHHSSRGRLPKLKQCLVESDFDFAVR